MSKLVVTNIRLSKAELQQYRQSDGAIGQVQEVHQNGLVQKEIGQAQAWLYPDDAMLVLWKCLLDEHYRTEPPGEDALFGGLWRNWERYLIDRCPGVRTIATLAWEPLYAQEHWQEFLAAQGYQPGGAQAFAKEVGRR